MLVAEVDERAVAVANQRVIPEGIAFDRGLLRAELGATAVPNLGLGPETLVAEQGAWIVAAADSVIAGRELLEAHQRLPGILRTHVQRQGQPGNRAIFARGQIAQ